MTTTPPPTPPENPYLQVTPFSPSDERLWSTLVHVGGIFFSFIPALIGYLALRERGPFVHAHTATALNFQLTMLLAGFIGAILSILLVGFFVIIAVSILIIVFSIIAAIASNNGQYYRYPLTIEFVK